MQQASVAAESKLLIYLSGPFFFLTPAGTQKTRGSIPVERTDACFALNFKWI